MASISYAKLLPFLVLPFLTGCPNPNSYGTPRTIPKGTVQHTVALEGIRFSAENRSGDESSFTSPTLPTYQLRYGVSDDVDFGVRVANLSLPGVDLKWNFLRGDIDLAVAPGVQATYLSLSRTSIFMSYFNLPLMVGFNVGRDVTVFVNPGITYLLAAGDNSSDRKGVVTASGVAATVGVGVQFRTSKIFAVTPQVSGMRFFNDADNLVLVFGLGFNFGSQPEYGTRDEPKPEGGQANPGTEGQPQQQAPQQQAPQPPAQTQGSPPPPPPGQ